MREYGIVLEAVFKQNENKIRYEILYEDNIHFYTTNRQYKMVKAKYNAPKVTDGISVEICKDSHRDLASTPRTEASTPESGEFKTYNIGDSGGRIDHNAKPSSKDNSCAERNLQRHYSQTDTHIQLLDRNGDLNEVAGSQSMLSQELIDHEHDQNDNDRSDDNASSYILGDLGLPEGSQSKSSIGIAKRLGLLTQTQEEEDDDEEEESMGKGERESTQDDKKSDELIQPVILATGSGPMPHEKKKKHDVAKKKTPNDASSPESDSSKKVVEQVPLSGLELLTQVGTANLVSSRENEGFGSLLDAVAKITEQEESGELSMNWRVSPTAAVSSTAAAANAATTTKSKKQSKKRKVAPSLPTTSHLSASKQRKSEMQKLKEKLRREKIQQENERAQAVAKKAAIIAERTISDPVIAKKLLLSMALARENPRSVPQILPGKGHVVQEGFFWVSRIFIANVWKEGS